MNIGFLKLGRSRLHRKIFLMMLLVGVLPIILAGLFSLYSVTSSHRISVNSIEENLINQKIEEVNSFVNDAVNILELRVGLNNIDAEFRNDLNNQEFLLSGLLASVPAIQDASFIETSENSGKFGKETSRIIRDEESKEGFILIRSDKRGEEEGLRDQKNLQYFTTAKGGDKYISSVNFTASGPMVTIAAPVRPNNATEIFSVLRAELSLGELSKIVLRSKLGKSGYVYVVDENARVIAPKDRDFNAMENSFVKEVLGAKRADGLGESARYSNFEGKTVAAYGKYIPALNWGIFAEWPAEDADVILNSLKYQIIIFSLIVLVAVVLISLFVANKIVGPIKELEAGTELIAQGKFDAPPVSIKTGDEIEDLGVAFNKMTDGLKQLQALKDEFVFIAAHELKTPVAAIKGYLSIINDGLAGPVSDKVKDFIKKVLNANARLIRLVEDLLEVARAEAGRIKIDVAPVNIVSVVNETLSELKPLADEKSIKFIYNPQDNLWDVMADNGRLREVLVNLIGNSIKYTLGAGGDIEITHELGGKGDLITHIKDHGMGMSKEAQVKLFQKFYRIQTKETATVSGTGLGLFIVKQIVEKMNGSIWVDSEPGVGSTFSFNLPLKKGV